MLFGPIINRNTELLPAEAFRTVSLSSGSKWQPMESTPANRDRLDELKRSYQDRLRSFTLYDYLIFHQREIVFSKCTWNGFPTLKNPFDAWIYQEIVFRVRPAVILEIGSYAGGSTAFFASLLDTCGSGQVLSVDIDPAPFQLDHPRVHRLIGDSQSQTVIEQVYSFCDGKRTLVVHDGDHRAAAVLADLRSYADLVALGSYFIIEDGVVDLFEESEFHWKGPGPLAATEAFLTERDDFSVDEAAERYILTYNPRGFLLRTSLEPRA